MHQIKACQRNFCINQNWPTASCKACCVGLTTSKAKLLACMLADWCPLQAKHKTRLIAISKKFWHSCCLHRLADYLKEHKKRNVVNTVEQMLRCLSMDLCTSCSNSVCCTNPTTCGIINIHSMHQVSSMVISCNTCHRSPVIPAGHGSRRVERSANRCYRFTFVGPDEGFVCSQNSTGWHMRRHVLLEGKA